MTLKEQIKQSKDLAESNIAEAIKRHEAQLAEIKRGHSNFAMAIIDDARAQVSKLQSDITRRKDKLEKKYAKANLKIAQKSQIVGQILNDVEEITGSQGYNLE